MDKKKFKVILTGTTGMVGEGVLFECLEDDRIEEVLSLSRRPSGYSHPKLKEIIHPDFFDLKPIESQLKGYNACFFCAGVSSVGMKEKKYYRLTYTMTLGFAEVFSRLNPGATFCYVSGAGTDSSEKGRMMWARVKGKTENDLQKLELDAYNFRPAFMIPRKGARNLPKGYRFLSGLFKLLEKVLPNYISGLDLTGKAMINVSIHPSDKKVLEVRDIRERADND